LPVQLKGTIDNAPQNIFRADPAINNWDLTLFKKLSIPDKGTVQL
jgi:hypothetical protein